MLITGTRIIHLIITWIRNKRQRIFRSVIVHIYHRVPFSFDSHILSEFFQMETSILFVYTIYLCVRIIACTLLLYGINSTSHVP